MKLKLRLSILHLDLQEQDQEQDHRNQQLVVLVKDQAHKEHTNLQQLLGQHVKRLEQHQLMQLHLLQKAQLALVDKWLRLTILTTRDHQWEDKDYQVLV